MRKGTHGELCNCVPIRWPQRQWLWPYNPWRDDEGLVDVFVVDVCDGCATIRCTGKSVSVIALDGPLVFILIFIGTVIFLIDIR